VIEASARRFTATELVADPVPAVLPHADEEAVEPVRAEIGEIRTRIDEV